MRFYEWYRPNCCCTNIKGGINLRTLYLDCQMGAAGDMLTAALLELLPDPDAFIDELNTLGIPGVTYEKKTTIKCGVTGTQVCVAVNGREEETADVPLSAGHSTHTGHRSQAGHGHDFPEGHEHVGDSAAEHTHNHEHAHSHSDVHGHAHTHVPGGHHHSSMRDIEHIVREHLSLPPHVQDDIMAVYNLIAEAESHVHGVPVTDIHFHEVGTMDAVADVTAVCLLMDRLAPDEVAASPVCTGSGQVRCAHGILPAPAPATAHILRGVPVYGGNIRGELCTPTGAALLKHFVSRFDGMPLMRPTATGYGMGKKDFEAANCIRAVLGETDTYNEEVCELQCNVDDMTAEALGFAMDRLFEAGALDVYTAPAGMKKNRPGTLICVLCRQTEKDRLIRAVFRHTTTIGIREIPVRRYVLDRRTDTFETPYGTVRRKVSQGYGTERKKYEYDDISRIATEKGISFSEALSLINELLEKNTDL